MSRIRKVPARELRKGDYLQASEPGKGDHRVEEVLHDFSDPTDPKIVVTTNQGVWRINWEKQLTFPRRSDGAIKDYRFDWLNPPTPDKLPTPRDLAVGDLLPPPIPIPTEDETVQRMIGDGRTFNDLPDYWRQKFTDDYNEHFQIVTGVWAHSVVDRVWYISAQDQHSRVTRTYDCEMYSPLYFPRKTSVTNEISLNRDGKRDAVRTYGPYQDIRTGTKLILAMHPTGRGRWPKEIPTITDALYDRADDGTDFLRTQPPSWRNVKMGFEAWDDLRFIGTTEALNTALFPHHSNGPHPKDPIRRRTVLNP